MTVIQVTPEEMDALLAKIEESKRRLADEMPDTFAALRIAARSTERLKMLGWRPGIYCPKDGSEFALVTPGCSTGVFTGFYWGEWPNGSILSEDEFVQPQACWWKPLADLSPEEEAARQQSAADTREFIDRLGRLAEMDEEPAPRHGGE